MGAIRLIADYRQYARRSEGARQDLVNMAYGQNIRLGLFIIGIITFLVLELTRPYRRPSVSKSKRWIINLSLTLINSGLLTLFFSGITAAAAGYAAIRGHGILNIIAPPYWIKLAVTLVFMDFMLYIWHFLNHELPLLWRFHRVHHTDLNMDVSTAARFHIGELAVSALIKASLVYFLGADPVGILTFECTLVLAAQFQHSSLDVSRRFEKYFWLLFVPPSMHRIHHSVIIKERNSNYGTILSIWDRLLGTLVQNVEQSKIVIGVGGHFDENKLNLHHLLVMPAARPIR